MSYVFGNKLQRNRWFLREEHYAALLLNALVIRLVNDR